jgi:cell fate regulator YaaT (PSP1 superfamily)
MAKNQSLPLAPAEISGLCGRLLCCLAYENEQYHEIKKTLPKVNSQVKTSEGFVGIVRGLNVLKETLLLKIEGQDNYLEVAADDVEVITKPSTKSRSRKQSGKSKNRQNDGKKS